jgi:hypothetical protein
MTPGLAGEFSDKHPVGIRSGTICVHHVRIEHDYAKGNLNSKNRDCLIRRVLECRWPENVRQYLRRPVGKEGAWTAEAWPAGNKGNSDTATCTGLT